jgi:hypothetical protein
MKREIEVSDEAWAWAVDKFGPERAEQELKRLLIEALLAKGMPPQPH